MMLPVPQPASDIDSVTPATAIMTRRPNAAPKRVTFASAGTAASPVNVMRLTKPVDPKPAEKVPDRSRVRPLACNPQTQRAGTAPWMGRLREIFAARRARLCS
jgi:hypothetical protein